MGSRLRAELGHGGNAYAGSPKPQRPQSVRTGAAEPEVRRHEKRFHISPDNTARLCSDIGQGVSEGA